MQKAREGVNKVKPSFNIHVTEQETVLYYFCEDKIIGVHLSYSPLRIEMYNGLAYIGDLKKGNVWCTEWEYKSYYGELYITCQVDAEIDCLEQVIFEINSEGKINVY